MSYSYEEDEVRSYSYQPSGIEDFATGYTEEGIPEEFVETPSDSSASSESGEDQLKKDWNAGMQTSGFNMSSNIQNSKRCWHPKMNLLATPSYMSLQRIFVMQPNSM